MAQPSDSRVRPDDLATSWEAYPHHQLADTLRHAHGYGRNLPRSTQYVEGLVDKTRHYCWRDHQRRLYWRALIDVAGVLLWILIALLLQAQAGD